MSSPAPAPPIVTMKPADVQKRIRPLVEKVLAARAVFEVETAKADERAAPILARYGFTEDDTGAPIVKREDMWKCSPPAALENAFYAELDEANRAAGYVLPAGHCPGLVAKCAVSDAERALLTEAAPLFGLREGMILSPVKRKEFIDLLCKLALAKS